MNRQTGKPLLPFVLAGLILTLAMLACGESASPTPEPTDTPAPTSTPRPVTIPKPTKTPLPTDTPEPTDTPQPTNTPTPEPTPTPERTEARVVTVVDGDTINVDIEGVVYALRYIGVDCPEPDEWGGAAATEANGQMVENATVYLEKDTSETDRYDRLLRYVYLEDGTFVNAELVRLGYAEAKAYPPDTKHHTMFAELEQEARAEKVGLWQPTPTTPPTSTPTPVPPTNTPEPIPPTNTPEPVPPTEAPPPPTNTPEPQAAPGDVQITYIFYDGVVARVESDEYAVVKNVGGSTVNLSGWHLNAGDPGQDFWFPGFELQPGQECRVYTNEHHAESCGFSFGSGKAIWNNKGDCGYLYDAGGAEVSRYCY